MKLYERIFDQTPDGLLVVDGRGCIRAVNAQTERMFGYPGAWLLGKPIEVLVPARSTAAHRRSRDRYLADPGPRPMGAGLQLSGRRSDGSEFPVDVMLTPIEGGDSPAVLCVVRDVTERRRADEKFRALLESAPDAMVILDETGKIVLVNSQTERVFGYSRDDLLGRPVEILMPDRYRARHPHHRRAYFEAPGVRPMGARLELYGLRKDGTEFPVEVSLSPLQTTEGTLVSSAIRDITDRVSTERELVSLREKEVLLKEVHHRVKNNLAVISSLFYLQSTYTRDEATIRILRESQDRVRSIALVHETLYRSDDLSAVDFAAYARDLSEQLIRSHSDPARPFRLHTQLATTPMSIGTAVPCALILNELITNALVHAYPDGAGEVHVRLDRGADGECVLCVEDAGVGIPEHVDVEGAGTLGMRLIRSLARQVEGRFELVRRDRGTSARLTVRSET